MPIQGSVISAQYRGCERILVILLCFRLLIPSQPQRGDFWAASIVKGPERLSCDTRLRPQRLGRSTEDRSDAR
jgi:hypothetical protein